MPRHRRRPSRDVVKLDTSTGDMLQRLWISYAEATYSETLQGPQRRELRRAFYCGVKSMMKIIHALSEAETSEEDFAVDMNAVEDELRAFAAAVVAGEK